MVNLKKTEWLTPILSLKKVFNSEDMAFAVQKETAVGAMVSTSILRLTEDGRLQQVHVLFVH